MNKQFNLPGVRRKGNMKKGANISCLVIFLLMMFTFGWADMAKAVQIFTTPLGATEPNNGEPVSAEATFSLSETELTITLTNTLAGIQDAGQLLTDVFFTLSLASTPTLDSQTGDLINVLVDKSVEELGSSDLGWGFGSATIGSLSGYELCVICQGGPTASKTPAQGILGPPSGDGKYENANGSIAGNNPHNPFVNQTATFVLKGITEGATVDDVIFSFSTTPGDNVPAPEPAPMLLLGCALIGLWGARRRLKQ
jgi:hypothetical protein